MLNKKQYIINRIINNNVIASKEQESEIVLMGKGLSFKKKVGDYIDSDQIEKIFVLKGREKMRYMDIIENISSEYIDLAVDILDYAQKKLKVKTTSISYITLADHMASAVERTQKGVPLTNQMLNEIRRFYPREFAIGIKALEKTNELYNITLPIDEAGFIAFHIMNLSGAGMDPASEQSMKLIQKVIEIVESYFEVHLDQDSIYYERFLTHLKYFSSRVFLDKERREDNKKNDFVYRMMKVQFPKATQCVELVGEYLDYNYEVKVNDEEKGYLIIHINNLLKKSKMVTKLG